MGVNPCVLISGTFFHILYYSYCLNMSFSVDIGEKVELEEDSGVYKFTIDRIVELDILISNLPRMAR